MRSMLLLGLLLVMACREDDPAGPNIVPSMTGTWYVGDSVSGSMMFEGDAVPSTARCRSDGRWDVVDTLGLLSGTFYGELRCGSDGNVVDSVSQYGQLAGSRTDATFHLQAGDCTFVGTFNPSKEAGSGTVTCSIGHPWYLEMSGDWRGHIFHYPTCDSPDCVWTVTEPIH